jgi:DNA-binding PadR family transcriptional regulator
LGDYEREFVEDFRERLIKDFMDIFVLAELSDGKARSGFDFTLFFHKKFSIMLSSGTIYSQLYRLERNGLLQRKVLFRKTIYSNTEKAQKIMFIILKLRSKIQEFLKDFTDDLFERKSLRSSA